MIRMIFSTVRAPQDPALTVESFAISATGWPSMVAVPVATPSAGNPSARALAYRPSSVKLPSSTRAAIRPLAKSLPRAAAVSWYLAAPPRSMVSRSSAKSVMEQSSWYGARGRPRQGPADDAFRLGGRRDHRL